MTIRRSRLVKRNFGGGKGRICMGLELELWSMLAEICGREAVDMTTLLRQINGAHSGNQASAVRVYIATYFHAIAMGGVYRTDHRLMSLDRAHCPGTKKPGLADVGALGGERRDDPIGAPMR
jgi:predicted DNA-binding ribbon-helix-helix protein